MRRHISQYSSKFDYDYTEFTNIVYTLMQMVILIIKLDALLSQIYFWNKTLLPF